MSQPVLNVDQVPASSRNYTLSENFCRLGAHSSIIVKNDKRHELVIADGTALFLWTVNGTEYKIPDLNPYLSRLDLSKTFTTNNPPFIAEYKKPLNVPVVNRGVLSADAGQDAVYLSEGHFYDKPSYTGSEYYKNKSDLPGDEVWKWDLARERWENSSFAGTQEGGGRRYGSAALSVPELDSSYCLGGLITPRSSAEAETGVFVPIKGMEVTNYSTGAVAEVAVTAPDDTAGESGYWHGSLEHLKVGCGKGFLLSLMAERGTAGRDYAYDAGKSYEPGDETTDFKSISVYSLDTGKWSSQATGWRNSIEPVLRTRFCSALRYSKKTNTWEYWLFGGQLRHDQSKGVSKIYVLTMPSFIWTEVTLPSLSDEESLWVRSHTCHAVGSQLLIVGGWRPADTLTPNVTCDQSLLRVIDMSGPSISQTFRVDTEYETPQQVVVGAELETVNRRAPAYGNGWADAGLERAFEEGSCGGDGGGLGKGAVIGIAVAAAVVGLVLVGLLVGRWRMGSWVWKRRGGAVTGAAAAEGRRGRSRPPSRDPSREPVPRVEMPTHGDLTPQPTSDAMGAYQPKEGHMVKETQMVT